ncbi:hypothetical protein MF672_007935 [Actinomadura sp. ATCC 31491]|uniref:Phosphotransferase n=1 Tax=Actinomadura luzonensis TaxID=2805427 RepID=A0ABT0FN01_9ACTN|nr:hypothetical protein [Actinomadura luzonensis]MCK2213715.1 hypothetical protein [Actinomadura luzonensis]
MTGSGTGYVLTAITRSAGGYYWWTRRPGPHPGGALRTPGPAVLAAVAAVAPGRVALTLPERAEATGVAYRTRQNRSLAAMLLGPAAGESDAEIVRIVAHTLAETGVALSRLHAVPPPEPGLPAPDGLVRLLSWLRAGHGPGAAAVLHRRASELLGRDRMATAAEWCLPPEGAPRVLLHGGPGLGILLPVVPGTDGALLTGENLAAGPPETDVGWLVGELVELGASVGRFGARRSFDTGLFAARVLDGYPGALDLEAVGRTAALRFLTHLHDFAAYLKWHDVLLEYLKLAADVLDAAAEGRLVHR